MSALTAGLIIIWGLASGVALFYSIIRIRKARADLHAHLGQQGNGAVKHAGEWRVHAAYQDLILATSFVLAVLFAILNALVTKNVAFGVLTLLALTAAPVVFAWKQRDDNTNHDKLLSMIATTPEAPTRRMMDQ